MAEFVVLASGSGTNFEAIAQAFRGSDHNLQALITDNPSAYALVRAENLGVPSIVVDYGAGRAAAEKRLLGVLTTLCPDLVVLAGFMKILPSPIVSAFTGRIVNIHPSILPAHPGMHAIERSFAEPSCRMGITIHTVDDGVDTGPVLAQFEVERTGHETLEEMERRIHELEHTHYPRIIGRELDAIALSRSGEPEMTR